MEARKFLESYQITNHELDPLPIKVLRNSIIKEEIPGQAVQWGFEYLDQRSCPLTLITHVLEKLQDEVRHTDFSACAEQSANPLDDSNPLELGTKYEPLKLMRAVVSIVDEICIKEKEDYHDSVDGIIESPDMQPHVFAVSYNNIKNSRRFMEDRMTVLPRMDRIFKLPTPISYFAVFDGHNGSEAASYGSAQLHQYLIQSMKEHEDIISNIHDAFESLDEVFVQKCKAGKMKSGSTAVLTLIMPNKLYVAWVGDSQAVLSKRNEINNLVTPHKPERKDEIDRIRSVGGEVLPMNGTFRVNGNLAVSRAIGDAEDKLYIISTPDIKMLELDGSEEFLILACDGLWDEITPEAAAQIVRQQVVADPSNISAISQKLISQAKQKGSTDNISVIVVFMEPIESIKNRYESQVDGTVVQEDMTALKQVAESFGVKSEVELIGGNDSPIGIEINGHGKDNSEPLMDYLSFGSSRESGPQLISDDTGNHSGEDELDKKDEIEVLSDAESDEDEWQFEKPSQETVLTNSVGTTDLTGAIFEVDAPVANAVENPMRDEGAEAITLMPWQNNENSTGSYNPFSADVLVPDTQVPTEGQEETAPPPTQIDRFYDNAKIEDPLQMNSTGADSSAQLETEVEKLDVAEKIETPEMVDFESSPIIESETPLEIVSSVVDQVIEDCSAAVGFQATDADEFDPLPAELQIDSSLKEEAAVHQTVTEEFNENERKPESPFHQETALTNAMGELDLTGASFAVETPAVDTAEPAVNAEEDQVITIMQGQDTDKSTESLNPFASETLVPTNDHGEFDSTQSQIDNIFNNIETEEPFHPNSNMNMLGEDFSTQLVAEKLDVAEKVECSDMFNFESTPLVENKTSLDMDSSPVDLLNEASSAVADYHATNANEFDPLSANMNLIANEEVPEQTVNQSDLFEKSIVQDSTLNNDVAEANESGTGFVIDAPVDNSVQNTINEGETEVVTIMKSQNAESSTESFNPFSSEALVPETLVPTQSLGEIEPTQSEIDRVLNNMEAEEPFHINEVEKDSSTLLEVAKPEVPETIERAEILNLESEPPAPVVENKASLEMESSTVDQVSEALSSAQPASEPVSEIVQAPQDLSSAPPENEIPPKNVEGCLNLPKAAAQLEKKAKADTKAAPPKVGKSPAKVDSAKTTSRTVPATATAKKAPTKPTTEAQSKAMNGKTSPSAAKTSAPATKPSAAKPPPKVGATTTKPATSRLGAASARPATAATNKALSTAEVKPKPAASTLTTRTRPTTAPVPKTAPKPSAASTNLTSPKRPGTAGQAVGGPTARPLTNSRVVGTADKTENTRSAPIPASRRPTRLNAPPAASKQLPADSSKMETKKPLVPKPAPSLASSKTTTTRPAPTRTGVASSRTTATTGAKATTATTGTTRPASARPLTTAGPKAPSSARAPTGPVGARKVESTLKNKKPVSGALKEGPKKVPPKSGSADKSAIIDQNGASPKELINGNLNGETELEKQDPVKENGIHENLNGTSSAEPSRVEEDLLI